MKVGIVGTGAVGSAAAYAMILQGTADEIVLVDLNSKLAIAQAQDITDATPFGYTTTVRAGDYDELTGAKVIILTAGVAQRPGDTRLDLLNRNADVFNQIIPHIIAVAPDSLLLIATNPVDIMTAIAAKISQLPEGRVFGSGTVLDSARFRILLSQHLEVSPESVHAYVLGEHGDSEVLWWSGVKVGGEPIGNAALQMHRHLHTEDRLRIDERVRRAAYHIIEGKGATWFGIGAALSRLTQAIGRNENLLLTVSAPTSQIEGIDHVTLSLPRVIGANGVHHTFIPTVDDHEKIKLRQSAEFLKEVTDSVRF